MQKENAQPLQNSIKKATVLKQSLVGMDWPMAIIVSTLVIFGLVMVFSASSASALYRHGDSFEFIRKQAIFAALGFLVMFIASYVDYHIFHRFAWPIMLVSIILLVVVLFMPEYNNARRWITIPGIGTLQPSDIAKFAVIILFAHIMSINTNKMKTFTYGVLPFLVLLGIISGLMLKEPHLSGTILVLGIGAVMMFIGGTSLFWFVLAAISVIVAVVGAVILKPDLVPYAMERIHHWIDPFSDMLGKGHQTIQSMYAISSGKLLGRGIGNSVQKHLYLPEPQNDFIFSIACEELGFIGAMLIITLFAALLFRGLYIAVKAKDRFGTLIVIGVTMHITLQTALNIAVVTNLIPNTGISLPFFSAGGTSLLMLMGEIGVVLNVSRQSSINKT